MLLNEPKPSAAQSAIFDAIFIKVSEIVNISQAEIYMLLPT